MKPLSPSQVSRKAQVSIPDYVIDAINILLIKEYRNGSIITLQQKDILKEIQKVYPKVNINEVFERGWMDFEPSFRKAGWKVSYDKPGFNESGEPIYNFSK